MTAMIRALLNDAWVWTLGSGQIQGGSSITQQVVKNVYLRDGKRTVGRKLSELRDSMRLARKYSKRQILEMYLNVVYLGRGAYGVQAAAKSYFRKDVRDLTISESAVLASLIHNPERYTDAEGRTRKALVARRDMVLERVRSQRYISDRQLRRAKAETVKLQPTVEERWPHPYFVDAVLRELGVLRSGRAKLDSRFDFLGRSRRARALSVYQGGLRIYTTLDVGMQEAAEKAVTDVLPSRIDKVSASLAAMDPRTGAVRAIVGGKDYYADGSPTSRVNLALGTEGGGSGRQPGSSFKPVVLATALDRGIKLRRSFDSTPFEERYQGQTWKVANYEGNGRGHIDLIDATVHSVNAAYAHLEIDGIGQGNPLSGAERVASMARRLGVPFATEEEVRDRCGERYMRTDGCIPASKIPAIALGAREVSPLTMARVYGTFAAGGKRARPSFIERIEDANGKLLYRADWRLDDAISPDIAAAVTHVLQKVIQQGTGTRARLGRPAAGKTGTSEAWRDAWFDGYTPQLVTSVWVGNPTGQDSMVPGNGYPFKVVGGTWPATIGQRFMSAALEGVPVEGFPELPQALLGQPDRSRFTLVLPPQFADMPGLRSFNFGPNFQFGSRAPRQPRPPRRPDW
jgi:penicillin-binding protein 1A